MESLKHECGVALVRLLKPLDYYQEKYGSWQYGLSKLYLMMEKQHNRGQEGAGLACVKTLAEPGEEIIYRERAMGTGGISQIFSAVRQRMDEYSAEQRQDMDFVNHHLPYAGEIYMGHLRYSTTGKRGLNYIHPFMRRSNWRAKNLCICANFNMTNVPEIFQTIASKGQHPRMMSDTYILLEQLGHRLDRESERCFEEAKKLGLQDKNITTYIEDHIDLSNMLKLSAPVWDGGYAIMGVTGSGETFVMRDPWGIRPVFFYKNDEVFAVASERPVLQTTFDVDREDIAEIKPGEALLLNKHCELRHIQILEPRKFAACSFERVYFSRGSDCDIYQERKTLGRSLVPAVLKAINNELDNTVFSYIPNTAEAAYYGMIEGFENHLNSLKTKEIENLMKLALSTEEFEQKIHNILNRRIRAEKIAWKDIKMRTFIAEGSARNDLAAHVYDITYGSLKPYIDNLVVIDDSIVRGTTLRESVIRILDRLHPKRIVIVSSAPQVRYPDFYGIDMSNMDDFIAFRAAVELLKDHKETERIHNIYLRCKEQLLLPKEKQSEVVRTLYEGFSQEEISNKMAEMLRPEGVTCEIKMVYQTLEGLHTACPMSPGDWYFSGHYPTPGGVMRVNQAFVDFYEHNSNKFDID